MKNQFYPFVNLPLPYAYDALEPFIDQKTMMLHHDRHLQTYINNLNQILEEHPNLQFLSLDELISKAELLPSAIGENLRNNAGGVYNHRFYFDILTNPGQAQPTGGLLVAILQTYGSFNAFKQQFKQAALSVFGSGYAWLVMNHEQLHIITTANQNTPLAEGMIPLLLIDVWEHAYYLKHYNMRSDYIDDWFQIINWKQVEQNFLNH